MTVSISFAHAKTQESATVIDVPSSSQDTLTQTEAEAVLRNRNRDSKFFYKLCSIMREFQRTDSFLKKSE
jgi:hypothetical protein